MRVKKFQARNMPEAMSMVKTELGDHAIILHSREKYPGIMGLFLGRGVEVTAAIDMKETASAASKTSSKAASPPPKSPSPSFEDLPPILSSQPEQHARTGKKFDYKVDDASNPKDAPNPLLEMTRRIQEESKKKMQEREEDEKRKTTFSSPSSPPSSPEDSPKIERRLIQLESQISKLTGLIEILTPSFTGGDVSRVPAITREIYNHLLDQDVDESLALSIATKIAEGVDENDDTWTALKTHIVDKIPTAPRVELEENAKSPKIIMLVGPTGVGKTTTLAKISAQYRYALHHKFKPKIAFITADLYRLAAVEQLQKYTEILGVDLEVTYSPDEVKQAVKKHKDAHLILFDTAGTAQRNMPQINTLSGIVDAAQPTEVHLVLSSTTKYSDAIDIIDHFQEMKPSRVIFSKIDESTTYGTLFNICMKYKIPVSYLTTGQNVPEDIEVARPERIAKLLLTKPTVNRSIQEDPSAAAPEKEKLHELEKALEPVNRKKKGNEESGQKPGGVPDEKTTSKPIDFPLNPSHPINTKRNQAAQR